MCSGPTFVHVTIPGGLRCLSSISSLFMHISHVRTYVYIYFVAGTEGPGISSPPPVEFHNIVPCHYPLSSSCPRVPSFLSPVPTTPPVTFSILGTLTKDNRRSRQPLELPYSSPLRSSPMSLQRRDTHTSGTKSIVGIGCL